MTNENSTYYYLEFSAKNSGIVGSKHDADDTLSKLTKEFEDLYGPDGYEILDFRPCTEEEKEAFKDHLSTVNSTDKTLN